MEDLKEEPPLKLAEFQNLDTTEKLWSIKESLINLSTVVHTTINHEIKPMKEHLDEINGDFIKMRLQVNELQEIRNDKLLVAQTEKDFIGRWWKRGAAVLTAALVASNILWLWITKIHEFNF